MMNLPEEVPPSNGSWKAAHGPGLVLSLPGLAQISALIPQVFTEQLCVPGDI